MYWMKIWEWHPRVWHTGIMKDLIWYITRVSPIFCSSWLNELHVLFFPKTQNVVFLRFHGVWKTRCHRRFIKDKHPKGDTTDKSFKIYSVETTVYSSEILIFHIKLLLSFKYSLCPFRTEESISNIYSFKKADRSSHRFICMSCKNIHMSLPVHTNAKSCLPIIYLHTKSTNRLCALYL